MSDRPKSHHHPSLQQRFIEFLGSNRTILLSVLALIVVGVVGSFVWLEVNDRRATAAAALSEELRTTYREWVSADAGEAEEGEAEEAREQIESIAAEILDRYANSFAAQRARFVLGNLHWEEGEFDRASQEFLALATEFPESYLAPVALFNAAVAEEELGESEEARGRYEEIVETYAESSAQVPRSLFALGRLSEGAGDHQEAAGYYNRILDEFGDSSWTTLARNRIIFLQTEGLVSADS